jgi:hypothetical protein
MLEYGKGEMLGLKGISSHLKIDIFLLYTHYSMIPLFQRG